MDFSHMDLFPFRGKEWLMMDKMCLGTEGVVLGYSWGVFDSSLVMVGSRFSEWIESWTCRNGLTSCVCVLAFPVGWFGLAADHE